MTLRRFVLILVLAAAAFGQRKEPATYNGPPTRHVTVQPPSRMHALPRPLTIRLGAISAAERGHLGPVGPMRRIGVHRSIGDNALGAGSWTALPDGRSIWLVALHSDGATGPRVEFSDFAASD